MSTTTRALGPPAPGSGARRAGTLLGSSIGKKAVMAVTGVVLFGFVVVHMIGNLQIYLGPDAFNAYAVFLRSFLHGGALWIARGVLLASVILHIWAATMLTLENRAARPVRYRVRKNVESTYASRTMVWSGPILAIFVVYHILHLTLGVTQAGFEPGNVYRNVVAGFQVVPVSIFYITAMLALGLHLYHGLWSMLQTLGLSHPRWNRLRMAFSTVFTVLVVAGNISIPVAVMAGWVR